MKRIKYLLSFVLLFFISISITNAASFKISTNKSTVVVGNTVKVTVSVNGSDAAGWEYCLNYDTSVFTLSSATSDTGGKCVKTGSTLTGYKTVTYSLKAKKSGSSSFTLSGAAIYNDDLKLISSSYNTVTVRAKTQAEIEASYSTNANLKSLSVDGYEISPSFNKDTLKYSLEVENEVDKVTIKGSKADSSASVSGLGEKELTEGINKFNIVVTAEKGNKKTYVVEITRKELNPINVIVDGDTYTIVRKADVLEAPTYYASTEIEIDAEKVPALKSEITGYTLVGLKDENGVINLYSYDEIENSYKLYKQFGTEGLVIIPLETKEVIEGFEKTKNITIGSDEVKVFVRENDSSFVIMYGMNAGSGKSGWYKYDIDEGTFQRYEKIVLEEKKEEYDLYFILAILFASLSAVTIILVIVLIKMNSKLRKKNIKLINMLEVNKSKKVEKVKSEKEEVIVDNTEETSEEFVYEPKEEIVEKEGLSQRELRRLEKEKAQAEKEELKKMQEDFLKTTENKVVEDSSDEEIIEEEEIPKKRKGRKRK